MRGIWIVALAVLGALDAGAQDAALQVGLKHAPPFVILEADHEPRGLSVDLIRAVAARMTPARTVEFVEHASLREHLDALRAGSVPLGIAATTVTAARSETVEFSPPFHSSGLGIVVSERTDASLLTVFFTPAAGRVLGAVLLYVLLCASLIWWIERGETFDRSAKKGIPEAIWWTFVTMSTVGYGDFAPRRPMGRALATVIILSGIALFGALVAEATSLITLAELRPSIESVDDLATHKVGVLGDTISEETLRERKIGVVAFEDLDAAWAALRKGTIDAVVHDRPLLRYRLQQDAAGLVLVGDAFHLQDYAIAFPMGSELRRPVSQALLRLREEEHQATYRALLARWLGDE